MLGTSLGSVDIVRKAQGMGCHVIVTDGLAPEASRAKLVADESWPIDTGNVGALEERCRAEGVGGVFAGVSEFNLDRTIELCGRLGLPCYIAPEGWETARNKGRFLDICHREGVPTADQYAPDPALMDQAVTELATGGVRDATRARLDEELAAVRFPVVVKPVDCSGNQGVSFCDTPEELVRAWQLVRQVSENPRVVVEQRLVGDEFSIVYALVGGQARMLRLGATYNEPGHPPTSMTLEPPSRRAIAHTSGTWIPACVVCSPHPAAGTASPPSRPSARPMASSTSSSWGTASRRTWGMTR